MSTTTLVHTHPSDAASVDTDSLFTDAVVQDSLLDLVEEPELGTLAGSVDRRPLTRGAWVDLRSGWLQGADALMHDLVQNVPWHAERRQMYERIVDVPRLLSFYDERDPLPHPILEQAKAMLNAHYGDELGEPFVTAGMCLYRDGRDSVAWHSDTIGRGKSEDTMVAILSIGAARALSLRPRGGSTTWAKHPLGHGDLIVMGGSCQRTWEHAITKTARPVGPRISIQFRPRGVR
ncbi:alpha-ketoglutarate-dependent dioxygenase AlkB [Microlunatus soli]|uniref:Alkylated DNA repair dioxygenase AlkB n=1 Tax=Microlunatus soli TaxID=630515 RepID=A0A1H1TNQ2_9ACTN|nr:alpha-ketoglutarate-dependent dioxygenase AlkB [Microlunatus soli]SDS61586.1 Alkylated DNA repair dioxygenase AlkB [Microlunatus soli]